MEIYLGVSHEDTIRVERLIFLMESTVTFWVNPFLGSVSAYYFICAGIALQTHQERFTRR